MHARALALLLALSAAATNAAAAECDARGWKLAFEGDSLTYGQDTREGLVHLGPINGASQSRSLVPFPEEVARQLVGSIVANRGFPGDRSIEGLSRWADADPVDVVIIMYGANDAGNFGGYPDGPLTPARFEQTLGALVKRRIDQGSKVILMTSPQVGDGSLDRALEPYRLAVAAVAEANAIAVVDTVALLHDVNDKWSDGLHLSPASNLAIADALTELLQRQYCPVRY